MKYLFLIIVSLIPLLLYGQVVKSFNQSADGVHVNLDNGTLTIVPITDNAVRIKFNKNQLEPLPELIFISGF